MDDIGSPARALRRMVVYVSMTLCLMPLQLFAVALKLPLQQKLPLWYHRRCCRVLGFEVKVAGQRSQAHPVLFIANHVSYFDIEVLGALIPGSFIAKAEVASWPFFNWLAKLQRTVFVARRASRTAKERDAIAQRLATGDNLILFAEGTSGDGNRVLPFKSALLAAAGYRVGGRPVTVQPVSITYTDLDGMPLGRFLRPCFAWYGDMPLLSHLWRAIGLGRATVLVEFHAPVLLDDFASRKALSDHCFQQVAQGMSDALSGRTAGRLVIGKTAAAPRNAVG